MEWISNKHYLTKNLIFRGIKDAKIISLSDYNKTVAILLQTFFDGFLIEYLYF